MAPDEKPTKTSETTAKPKADPTRKYGTQYEFHKLTGVPKSTIKRAVDDGKVQLHHQPDGRDLLFFAEAYTYFQNHISRRVQATEKAAEPTEPVANHSAKSEPAPANEVLELSVKLSGTEAELKQLRERLRDKDGQIDDLKQDRDHWRDQHNRMTLLLSSAAQQEQQAANDDPGNPSPQKNWFQRLFGK